MLDEYLGPMPPFAQLFDFMSEGEHTALLDWAIANEDLFQPAQVNAGRVDSQGRIDREQRVALTMRKLGPLKPMLRARLMGVLDEASERTGTRGERPTSLELELAAHGDGAHFAPHRDIPIGADRKPLSAKSNEDRLISAVYYFYAEPRAFSGGNLRLYRFGADPEGCGAIADNHVDIEPVQNSLIVFPSWVTHEVRRVSCPSGDFKDYRFALNCWFCRPITSNRRG